MIFVTVGTQKFPFNRIFKELDYLVETNTIQEVIIAQRGCASYIPKCFKSVEYMTQKEMAQYLNQCSVFITHAGTASIVEALKKGKKIVVVPRIKRFCEHVDDHQLEIAQLFEEKDFVETVYDISQLSEKINLVQQKKYNQYIFNNQALLGEIDYYLSQIKIIKERKHKIELL